MKMKNSTLQRYAGTWLMALLSAHYILYVPQQHALNELLHQKAYYTALIFSTLVAWLLIQLSCSIHRLLHRFIPFELHFYSRLFAQLLIGVGLVAGINILLVRVYFWYFHRNFGNSGYLQVEAQIVFWMLICLNVFLVGYDFYQDKQKEKIQRNQDQEFLDFIYGNNGMKKSKIALEEIICFYNESHIGYVYLLNGEVWNTNYILKTLGKQLHPHFGYQINRSMLVNWQAIKAYQPIANMQGKVILRHNLEVALNVKISRERFRNFKLLYASQKR